MNKFSKKFLTSCLLISIMALNSLTVFATPVDTRSEVYSPEFPNAYVETENVLVRSANGPAITASVYVQEFYQEIDGELICTNSQLLSKNQVDKIGKENFDGSIIPRSDIIPGVTEVKEKLSLTFSIPSQPSAHKYKLRAYAEWNGGSGKTGPASGDDFLGFAWGGGFNYSSDSIGGKTTSGTNMSIYQADVTPNAAKVWGFSEASPPMDYVNAYITIYKNSMDGNGNTTSFMAKYIHSYQSSVGAINITAGPTGIGGGFSLSNCSDQWSLVADLTGFEY